jgi:hypothetical protein
MAKSQLVFSKNKKGIVFSIVAIILVIFFMLIYTTVSNEYVQGTETYLLFKAKSAGGYESQIVNYYLPIALKQSSYAAIYAMINFTGVDNTYIPPSEFQNVFRSLVKNGNFSYNDGMNTYNWSINASKMENKTLSKWVTNLSINLSDSISTLAEETTAFGFNDSLTIVPDYDELYIYQSSPWEITVISLFNVTFLSSEFQITNLQKPVVVKIPIIGMRDPNLLVNSHGSLEIEIHNETEIINVWDISKLKSAIKNHKYYASSRAPEFLMRFQNVTNSSSNGIETFIDPVWVNTSLIDFNSTYMERSYVDFMFFNKTNCKFEDDSLKYLYNVSDISNLSSYQGFRLDLNSTVKYVGIDFNVSAAPAICRFGFVG